MCRPFTTFIDVANIPHRRSLHFLPSLIIFMAGTVESMIHFTDEAGTEAASPEHHDKTVVSCSRTQQTGISTQQQQQLQLSRHVLPYDLPEGLLQWWRSYIRPSTTANMCSSGGGGGGEDLPVQRRRQDPQDNFPCLKALGFVALRVVPPARSPTSAPTHTAAVLAPEVAVEEAARSAPHSGVPCTVLHGGPADAAVAATPLVEDTEPHSHLCAWRCSADATETTVPHRTAACTLCAQEDLYHDARYNADSLWFALVYYSSDVELSMKFCMGLIDLLGVIKEVDPDALLVRSTTSRNHNGDGSSNNANNHIAHGCPCGCIGATGKVVDHDGYRFHRFYYRRHAQRRHLEKHEPSSSSSTSTQPTHISTSQYVPMMFLTLQILSNFMAAITEKRRRHGIMDGSAVPLSTRDLACAYENFFTMKERETVVATCVLLAWKQVDGDAANIPLLSHKYAIPPVGPEPCSCRTCVLLGKLPTSSLEGCRSFLRLRAMLRITNASLHEMEWYIFNGLRCRIASAPQWSHVALDAIFHYYGEELPAQIVAHYRHQCDDHHHHRHHHPREEAGADENSCATSAEDDRQQFLTRQQDAQIQHELAVVRLLQCAMRLLLGPMLLVECSIYGTDEEEENQHAFSPHDGADADKSPQKAPASSRALREEVLTSMYHHLAKHPLLGIALAVHAEAIPRRWALNLVGPRACGDVSGLDEEAVRADQEAREELQSLLRELTWWMQNIESAVHLVTQQRVKGRQVVGPMPVG